MSRFRLCLLLALLGSIATIAYGIWRFPSYRFLTSFDRAVLLIQETGDINYSSDAVYAATMCRTPHDRCIVEKRCVETLSENGGRGVASFVATKVLIEGCQEVSGETLNEVKRILERDHLSDSDRENLKFLLQCLERKAAGRSGSGQSPT